LKFTPKLPEESVNVSKQQPFLDLLWMGAGVMGTAFILYFGLGLAIEYGAKKVSTENEIAIFEYFIDDENITENQSEVDLLLASLIEKSKHCYETPYHFRVSLEASDEINAYAMPGGTIVINTALYDETMSENELFFVLAHEMGHFKNRDHLEGLGRSFVGMAIGSLFGMSDISDMMDSTLELGENKLSQKQESDADRFAVEMMQCYYGHVGGDTDFFSHLPQEETTSWFSSHPAVIKRIDAINAYAKSKGYESRELLPLEPLSDEAY